MRYHFSLFVTLAFIVLIQCNSKEHLNLTKENLIGNWYYIDSICDPGSEYGGHNYLEVSFNDSIFINYSSARGGIGPTYSRYEVSNDSILIYNSGVLTVLEFKQNKMKIEFDCNQKVQFELIRMELHKNPLKEFYNDKELEDFGGQVRYRQYSTLKELGLLK